MGAAASALRHRGRLQLDAGSVKAPFSRQKSRKIATVTKAPAKKSPAARNVVTHLLIPYRRRRCAAGRNPTPHGRTCGAAPTLRAGPNNLPKISARPPLSYFPLIKGRAHARCQTVEYGVFVHPLVLSSGARHGPRIARPHGVTVLKLELSASTTTQAPAAMGAEGLITQEELPAEPDSGSEGSSTPLCPPWRPAGARPRSSLSPR